VFIHTRFPSPPRSTTPPLAARYSSRTILLICPCCSPASPSVLHSSSVSTTMAFRASTGLVAFAAAAALTLGPLANGHVQQQFPISRQYAWSRDFYDSKFDNVENKPYAYNAGGVKEVQARAKANTDPTELAANGGGDRFPLYFQPRASNGNYLESNELAKRHGVCGDPRLGGTAITYSTPNSEWEVLDTFVSGQEIEIDVVVVFYHWGHLEFFICDTADLDDPDDVVTQECFNKYPLTRTPDANAASPIDPDYPGRYYMDPPCRKDEVEQNVGVWVPQDPYNVRMRYLLPDIECEHCVLQMHYMSGDRCRHIGVDEFNPASWNSDCAPNKEDWIDLDTGSICGQGGSYPEEFWACSDFAITSSERPLCGPFDVVDAKHEACTSSHGSRNDMPGIEGSNDSGSVCCPIECGQCGGDGCHQAGLAVGLDNTHCCVNGVLDNHDLCSDSGAAPCII
ncbi:unnamed protein product, partial [Scytosiphon promiscuus]